MTVVLYLDPNLLMTLRFSRRLTRAIIKIETISGRVSALRRLAQGLKAHRESNGQHENVSTQEFKEWERAIIEKTLAKLLPTKREDATRLSQVAKRFGTAFFKNKLVSLNALSHIVH